MTNELPNKLLTMDDLVQMLGRTKRTIARDRAAGVFPSPLKIGRQVRWHPSDVAAWLESRRQPASHG